VESEHYATLSTSTSRQVDTAIFCTLALAIMDRREAIPERGAVPEPGQTKAKQVRTIGFCSRCKQPKELVTTDKLTGEKFCDACRVARTRNKKADSLAQNTQAACKDMRKARRDVIKIYQQITNGCMDLGVSREDRATIKAILRPYCEIIADELGELTPDNDQPQATPEQTQAVSEIEIVPEPATTQELPAEADDFGDF